MSESKVQAVLDRLEKFKDEIETAFKDLGLGKDAVIDVHNAIDSASKKVVAHDSMAPPPEPVEEKPKQQSAKSSSR